MSNLKRPDIPTKIVMAEIFDSLGEFTPVGEHDWSEKNVANGPTGELPAMEPWSGPHHFDVQIDLSSNYKNKYYSFSAGLRKLFVDLGKNVVFKITWDGTPDLSIRAMMMFSEPNSRMIPVLRCRAHMYACDSTNLNYEHIEHIVGSENPHARYEVNENSRRHSVVVPLTRQSGCDHDSIIYKFMCKTSCAGGINRKPTVIVFTLEDRGGMVLGRQTVGIKICSCPKRDMTKEEMGMNGPPGKMKPNRMKKDSKAVQRNVDSHTEEFPLGNVFNPDISSSSTFTVTAVNSYVAKLIQDHLRKWSEIKSIEFGQPGAPTSPLLYIHEDESSDDT